MELNAPQLQIPQFRDPFQWVVEPGRQLDFIGFVYRVTSRHCILGFRILRHAFRVVTVSD